MVSEYMSIKTERYMKAIGSMTRNMEMELKNGQMVVITKDNIFKGSVMVKVLLIGHLVAPMMVNLKIIN